MHVPPLQVGSACLQLFAAWQSLVFLWTGRLGRVWSLVSLALFLKGLLTVWEVFSSSGSAAAPFPGHPVEIAEFFISLLLASGFLLTGQWFRFKERIEARFDLIVEVERSLVGVLEEGRILSLVCEILSRRNGYPLAWIGTASPDGTIRVECNAGSVERFLEEVPLRWDDTHDGQTPPGIALRKGGTITALGGEGRFSTDWRDASGRSLHRIGRFRIRRSGSAFRDGPPRRERDRRGEAA
jgi:hypothetical protein